jgi:hypothetical protein
MILRNCRSASSIPAAVQRSAISPDCQRLTLGLVRRTHSIIDSHGFVEASVRFNEPVMPRRATVSVSASPSRSDPCRAGMAALQLDSQSVPEVLDALCYVASLSRIA